VLPIEDGALTGIRVVELSSGVAGPFCARLFADYGAEVIKVEPPGLGDPTRRWGPFPGDRPHREKSGTFLFLNTNKRGITLDLDVPEDRERCLELVRRADVLIASHRPRQLRDWAFDYSALSTLNPGLVMISVTPFGQTGPYADWNGYDLNAYHLSGCGSRYCGRPDDAPLEHGTFSADFFAGYAAAAWGLASVLGRDRLGGGQHIDVSSAEVLAALFVGALNIGGYAQDGVFDRRGGAGLGLAAPADILPCKDGHVLLIALETAQWRGLRVAMGDPEWARADLFDDMRERGRNSDLIYEMLRQWTLQHSKEEIMALCQANGCPATAVYTVADLARHPHLEQREYLVELDHPEMGRVRDLGAPIRLPGCPGGPRTPAPLLGQHDAEIFEGAEAMPFEHETARPAWTAPVADRARGGRGRALPLEGLRVANFGWGLVGPTAGQLLAFLGAEVYKIESRARPDIQRTIPPFYGGIPDPDRSIQNHAFWAGNRSVTLNLKTQEGQGLARQLVAISDVVIENFATGVMERLNLGYDTLRTVAPEIVMASLSSTGNFGPLADLRTYGNSLASLAGLDSVTGYAGGPMQAMENAYSDPLGGVIGALGVLLALHCRERTGRGQHIDYSQLEGIIQLVGPAFIDYLLNGRIAGPIGNRHPVAAAAPHGVFPCRGEDRWIAIAVGNDEEWRGLVRALDCEWARDTGLAEAAGRIERIDTIHERLAEWTRQFGDYELAERLQGFGVAATPVLDVSDLLEDAHYRARGTFIRVVHPLGFEETIYGAYVKTSRSEPDIRPGPAVGQDNEQVFKELLGMPEARYRELVERKVIF
jgi:crotonobetainyl-CoA:carnitine CoA-transferase CaiB-like acyl-CoA transferase